MKLVHSSENRMCAGVLQVAWRLQKAKMKHQNTCLCFMLPLLLASFSVDGQQKKKKNGHLIFIKQLIKFFIIIFYNEQTQGQIRGLLLEKVQLIISLPLKFKREVLAHEKCSLNKEGHRGQQSWEGGTAASASHDERMCHSWQPI